MCGGGVTNQNPILNETRICMYNTFQGAKLNTLERGGQGGRQKTLLLFRVGNMNWGPFKRLDERRRGDNK